MKNNNDTHFFIDNVRISSADPVFVIAEIGQAHDGSLGNAHAYIDAVASTGAQAIKFQTHFADQESSKYDVFRKPFSYQDKTRYEYWKRTEFTKIEWEGLYKHAMEVGLIFLSTPFSFKAVNFLKQLGVKAWKIGSGEVNNLPMLEEIAKTNLPVILSTGLSDWSDIECAISIIKKFNNKIALLQCTTSYPCDAEDIGLNVIAELRSKFNYPCGLSDHSGYIYPSIGATALGADVIEVHTVFSKDCFGPDTSSSITISKLKELVAGCQFIRKSIQKKINKNYKSKKKKELENLFGKSVYASKKIIKGEIITKSKICLKKPVIGVPAKYLNMVIGKKTIRTVEKDEPVYEQDIN